MNLTLHIVKKDLRALKWPLLVWTLVIVAKLGVGVAMLTAVGTVNADWLANWFVRMDFFTKVLAALECVSFVLVAAVIHEDLLVGTTAFWMTRPISGARLLCAKIVSIGLMFFVLPVLVTLPWWLGCGYGLREIVWAALEIVVVQAACVLLGLLWSVVTDGFARFLMWTLVLLFAVPSISSVIGLYISNLKVKPTPDLILIRIWAVVAIGTLATLVVTVHQFLTRRTWRSVGIIGVAVGLSIAAGLWWPWDWEVQTKWNAYMASLTEQAAQAEKAAEPGGLKFTVAEPRLMPRPGIPRERLNGVQVNFSVDGIPDARVLLPQGGRYTLQWADGTTDSGYGMIRNNQDAFRRAAWQSLGLPLRATEAEGLQSFTATMTLPAAMVTRAHAEQPAFKLKSVYRLLKFESAAKFPLQPGARIMTNSMSDRVAHVETMDGQILVTYIKSLPEFVLGDKVTKPYPRDASPYSIYGLVNQAAGKFDLGRRQWYTRSRVASVQIALDVVAYGNKPPLGRKSVLPEAWLRDAELIRQTFIEEVRFSHEMEAAPFPTEIAAP